MLNTRGFGFSVLMMVVMVLVAVPVSAAPAVGPASEISCMTEGTGHPLGVDGGLAALSTGEFTGVSSSEIAVSSAASSAVPLGVDGGLTSLLFTRQEAFSTRAYAAVSCGGASAAS